MGNISKWLKLSVDGENLIYRKSKKEGSERLFLCYEDATGVYTVWIGGVNTDNVRTVAQRQLASQGMTDEMREEFGDYVDDAINAVEQMNSVNRENLLRINADEEFRINMTAKSIEFKTEYHTLKSYLDVIDNFDEQIPDALVGAEVSANA
jgi:hypothetical protein